MITLIIIVKFMENYIQRLSLEFAQKDGMFPVKRISLLCSNM